MRGYTPLRPRVSEGFTISYAELAEAVFAKLGYKVIFQEINWDSKEIELNAKNIDCIWNGMTITPERAENMQVTIPYMQNKQAVVVKAD